VNEVRTNMRNVIKAILIGLTVLIVLSGSLILTTIAIIGWSLYFIVKLKRSKAKREARITYLKESLPSETLEGRGIEVSKIKLEVSRMLNFNGNKLIEVVPTMRKFVLDEKTPLVLLVSRFKVIGVGGVKILEPTPEVEEELALLSESMQENGIDMVVYGRLGYLRKRTPVHLLVYTRKFTLKVSQKVVEDLGEKIAYALTKLASTIGNKGKYGLLTTGELCALLEGGVDIV